MKAEKVWVLAIILLTVTTLFYEKTLATDQVRFHSETNGYSFVIPKGWIQIPEDIVRERYSKVLSSRTRAIVLYEAEFQMEGKDKWFECPTILVQMARYSALGIRRALHKDEFSDFVKSFTGRDVMESKDELFGEVVTDVMTGYHVNKVVVDKANRRYTYVCEITIGDSSVIKSEVVGYFGKEAIAQLVFNHYAEADWSQFETDRNLIFGSFQFDPGMQHEDAPSKSSGILDRLREAAARGLSYGLIAIVLGIIFGLFKLITFLSRSEKKSGDEQKHIVD